MKKKIRLTFNRPKKETKNILENKQTSYLSKILKSFNLSSPSILSQFKLFTTAYLEKLDFCDENMVEIYSEAFLFEFFKMKPSKRNTNRNIQIIRKAMDICREYIEHSAADDLDTENSTDNFAPVINLYKIE